MRRRANVFAYLKKHTDDQKERHQKYFAMTPKTIMHFCASYRKKIFVA
jgi:hypothetical protein